MIREGIGETGEAELFKTKEEYGKYLLDCFGYMDEKLEDIIGVDVSEDTYDSVIKYLNDGYTIMHKYVDYSDETVVELINCIEKDNKDFIILEAEN